MFSLPVKAESYFSKKCKEAHLSESNENNETIKQIEWLKKIFDLDDCKKIEHKIRSLKSFSQIIATEYSSFGNRNRFKPFELLDPKLSEDFSKFDPVLIKQTFLDLHLFKDFKNLSHFFFDGDDYNQIDLCQWIEKAPHVKSVTIARTENINNSKCIIDRNLKVFIIGEYKPTTFSYKIKDQIYGIDNFVGNIEDMYLYSRLSYLGLEKYSGTSSLRILSENKNLTNLHANIRNIETPQDIISLPYLRYLSLNCYEDDGSKPLDSEEERNCKKRSLKNIEFLRPLEFLNGLDLSNNEIIDLSPIANFKFLEKLSLRSNKVEEFSDLKVLKTLRFLDLSHNKIKNISNLKAARRLEYLNLSTNQISKIKEVTALKELKFLAIGNNPITDFRNLSGLEKLKLLDIDSSPLINKSYELTIIARPTLKNIFPIKEEREWAELILFGDKNRDQSIRNTQPTKYNQELNLKSLSNIKVLSLANTLFTKTTIKDLHELRYLDLSNSKHQTNYPARIEFLNLKNSNVVNISFINSLKKLNVLDLSENQINTAIKLNKIDSLETLRVQKCGLKSADFISNYPNLVFLDIDKNQLTSFEYSSKKIYMIDLSHNLISELPDFSRSPELRHVFLNFNLIKNLDILKTYLPRKDILSIDVNSNQIENLLVFKDANLNAYDLSLEGNNLNKFITGGCPVDTSNRSVTNFCRSIN